MQEASQTTNDDGVNEKVVKESKSLDEKDYPMEAIGVDKLERYINDYDVILVMGPQLSHKYDFH